MTKLEGSARTCGVTRKTTSGVCALPALALLVFLLALVESMAAHHSTVDETHGFDSAWAPTDMIIFEEVEFLSSFANDVALSPFFAAVAARTGSNQEGNVYLYQLQGGQFAPAEVLRDVFDIPTAPPHQACRNLGSALALSSTALVAVCGRNTNSGGTPIESRDLSSDSLYVFSMNEEGFDKSVPPELITAPSALTAPSPTGTNTTLDMFGFKVALSHNTLVVSSSAYEYASGLPVYVYLFNNETGLWGPEPDQMLAPIDYSLLSSRGFGCSVDISENSIIVGTAAAIVYFYQRTHENSTYIMEVNFKGLGTFGKTVAINSRVAAAGDKNTVQLYRRYNGSNRSDYTTCMFEPWLQFQSPYFLNGGTYGLGALVMSEQYFMVADENIGEVYLYTIPAMNTPIDSILYDSLMVYQADSKSSFGHSLALDDRHAIVGSYTEQSTFNHVSLYPSLVTSPPCNAGYGLQGDVGSGTASCTLCAAGAYSMGGDDTCHSCPRGEYSDSANYVGASSCIVCPENKLAAYIGSGDTSITRDREYIDGINHCVGLVDPYYDYEALDSLDCECSFHGFTNMHISAISMLGISCMVLLSLSALAIVNLIKHETVPMTNVDRMRLMRKMMHLTLFPVMDLASDTVYLFYTVWATDTMFMAAIAVFFVPMVIFCDFLYKSELYPKMYLGRPPDWVFPCEEMNSLPAVIITGITTLPWTLINLPIMMVTFFTGYVLYSTKLLAMRPVRNTWLLVWSGTDKYDMEGPIDLSILNQSVYAELWVETVPQVVLQIFNNFLMGTWTDFGILSICVSAPIVASAMYCWIFYVYNRGLNVPDIPTGLEWYVEKQFSDRGDGATSSKKLLDDVKDDVESPQLVCVHGGDSDDEEDGHEHLGAAPIAGNAGINPLHGGSEGTEMTELYVV